MFARSVRAMSAANGRPRRAVKAVAAVAAASLGCADVGAVLDVSDAGRVDDGCVWGRCAGGGPSGPRCVATGMADGSWLTADWSDDAEGEPCTAVPPELRDPGTPGSYLPGAAPIGEVRCEGLRPGAATLRVRLRVRLLASRDSAPVGCACMPTWHVGLRVLIDGRETTAIEGLTSFDVSGDRSCRRGPDVFQVVPATVGPDGTLDARVELGRCERLGTTRCVFLRGTGLSVEQ